MRSNNDVKGDLKAAAQDVLQMGARCVQAGREWLDERRNEMTDRNDEYPTGDPAHRAGRRYGQGPQHGQGQQYGQQPPGESTSRGYEWDDDRPGVRGQGGWGQGGREQDRSGQYRYGLPRQDRAGSQSQQSAEGYRSAEAGRYQQQGGYDSDRHTGRQAGEGYGRSSGYGNPQQDRYASDSGYGGASFVSPADTQLGHSGLGRQNYSGMGPKNYKRSDERITEDLCERLTRDHDIDASELDVRIADGTATLEGTVPQRWMKHRAEDLADGCAGVRTVENRIKVQSPGSSSASSAQRDTAGGTDTLANPGRRPGGTAH